MNSPRSIALALSIAAVCLCVLCPVLLGVAYTLFQEIVYPASLAEADALIAPVATSTELAEAEYYRGAFDVCVYFYINTGGDEAEALTSCNGFADRLEESSWHLVESKGYEP